MDSLRINQNIRCLKSYSVHFYTEKDISPYFEENEKSVDFLIPDGNKNILIDAKGVELPKLGMLTHVQNILADKTKTSLLKGIEQGFSTANKIADNGNLQKKLNGNEKNYLLIISFKDLYVGNGKDFYEYIAKDRLDSLLKNYPRANFTFEDIYFLSIEDFELLLEIVKKTSKTISEIIEIAKSNDTNNETKKFLFRQHLEEILSHQNLKKSTPEYIEEAFLNLTKDCIALLNNKLT